MIALFAYWQWAYFVPARSGTDQNGYLTTARLIAHEARLSFVPQNSFQFVGLMMVMTPGPHSRIYAKYPMGYPLMAAVCRLGGRVAGAWAHQPQWAIYAMYLVNPLCTVLACFLSFFLFRRLVGNFTSLMGVLLLACNPITLIYTNEANSHASSLLCVVVGYLALFSWWEKGGKWRGLIGGMALGYACTIRYSEFLLLAPLLFVVLAKVKLDLRRFREVIPPLLGWIIPLAIMAIALWIAYGRPWRTGYDLCKEQTGFRWRYFWGNSDPAQGPLEQGNWSRLLFHLNHLGLFMLLPLVMAGLIGLFWYAWRLATTLALWVLPLTILYMFYYWGLYVGDERSTSYLRFYLTVVPGLLMAGLWALDRAIPAGYAAKAIAVGAITALACAINATNVLPQLESAQRSSLALRNMADLVRQKIPANQGNVIFADQEPCNQLDADGGYLLYDLTLFRPGAFERFKKLLSPEKTLEPYPIQTERSVLMVELLGRPRKDGTMIPKTNVEIDRIAEDLIDQTLGHGKRIAFIFRGEPNLNMLSERRDLKLFDLGSWQEPAPMPNSLMLHWLGGIAKMDPPPDAPTPAERRAMTWHIYELRQRVSAPAPSAGIAGSTDH